MNRFEALTQFNNKSVKPQLKRQLRELDSYFRLHFSCLKQQLLDSFTGLCRTLAAEQQAGRKGPIAYINLSLLRISLEENAPVCQWDAYDATWYRDRQSCSREYDAGWALGCLEQIIQDLEPERKKYAGVILPQHLSSIKRTAVGHFHNYVVQLARLAFREARPLEELQNLQLAERLLILAGEYLDTCQVVYVQDERPLSSGQLKTHLERQRLHAYHVFKNCDLANGHYSNINLCYSTLDGSNLSHSDMQGALLVGSSLRNCNLSGVKLARSYLHDADLFGGSLQGADLAGVKGGAALDIIPTAPIDLTQIKNRLQLGDNPVPSYYHLNLQNTSLQDADFTGADLRGADLRGAAFYNTNFTDCQLDKAVFCLRDQNALQLTRQQAAAINWVEDGL